MLWRIHIFFFFFEILKSIHGGSLRVSHVILPLWDFKGTVCSLELLVIRQDPGTGDLQQRHESTAEPSSKKSKSSIYPLFSPPFPLSCFMGSLAHDSCPLTGSLWLYSVGRWERARWARSPSRQDAIPSSWACVLLQCLPVLRLPPICLRLIRRCQDSQGRTSECSDASAAVVELNFLISSIPLRCQETGLLQYSLSHSPPPFHLIKAPSIMRLWGSSYHGRNRVYFLFEHHFRCSIAQEKNSFYPTGSTFFFGFTFHAALYESIHRTSPKYNQYYDEVTCSPSKRWLSVERWWSNVQLSSVMVEY